MIPRKFNPGPLDAASAKTLTEAVRELAKLQKMLVPQTLASPDFETFDAKITANTGGKHSWTEQWFDSTAGYVNKVNGRVGTATVMYAFERNGLSASIFPFYAKMTQRIPVAGVPVYEFDLPINEVTTTPGAIKIDDDKGHAWTPIDEVQLNNSVATNVGTKATWQIDYADTAAPGIVSLDAQIMGNGIKSFRNAVIVNYDKQVTGGSVFDVMSGDTTDNFSFRVQPKQTGGPIYFSLVTVGEPMNGTPGTNFSTLKVNGYIFFQDYIEFYNGDPDSTSAKGRIIANATSFAATGFNGPAFYGADTGGGANMFMQLDVSGTGRAIFLSTGGGINAKLSVKHGGTIYDGVTTTFATGDARTATVKGGLIVNIA